MNYANRTDYAQFLATVDDDELTRLVVRWQDAYDAATRDTDRLWIAECRQQPLQRELSRRWGEQLSLF